MKKTLIYTLLTIILTMSVMAACPSSGSGTEGDPYLIYTNSDWDLIPECDLTAHYKLMNDLTGTNPINYPYVFAGFLDGNFHTISEPTGTLFYDIFETVKNLRLTWDYPNECSLLAQIVDGAYLDNITIEWINISAGTLGCDFGAVANLANSPKINGLVLSGEVHDNGQYLLAGIAPRTDINSMGYYEVKNADINLVLEGGNYCAGLYGDSNDDEIVLDGITGSVNINCAPGGNPNGGLLGNMDGPYSISNANINVNILSAAGDSGGFVGMMSSTGSINSSRITGVISGGNIGIGGLIGSAQGATIKIDNTATNLAITCVGQCGGAVGDRPGDTTINGLNISGTISVTMANSYIGGVLGMTDDYKTINMNNLVVDIDIDSSEAGSIGGIIGAQGMFTAITIRNASVVTNINAPGYNNLGGIIGEDYGGMVVDNVDVEANITGATWVGGIVGYSYGSTTSANYTYITTKTILTANQGVGGIIGSVNGNEQFLIENIDADTEIYAQASYIGGIVGEGYAPTKISKTKSKVKIVGTGGNSNTVGGILGLHYGPLEISQVYSEGTIDADFSVAGIISDGSTAPSINITDTYSTVELTDTIGDTAGIINYCSSNCLINKAYYAGKINNISGYSGGIAGVYWNREIALLNESGITDSYWDKQKSGINESFGAGAQAKTTTEMKRATKFSAAWDENTWLFCADGYPELKIFGRRSCSQASPVAQERRSHGWVTSTSASRASQPTTDDSNQKIVYIIIAVIVVYAILNKGTNTRRRRRR